MLKLLLTWVTKLKHVGNRKVYPISHQLDWACTQMNLKNIFHNKNHWLFRQYRIANGCGYNLEPNKLQHAPKALVNKCAHG